MPSDFGSLRGTVDDQDGGDSFDILVQHFRKQNEERKFREFMRSSTLSPLDAPIEEDVYNVFSFHFGKRSCPYGRTMIVGRDCTLQFIELQLEC